MIATLRLYIDLLRRRCGPSDLPTSSRLLVLTFVGLVALQGVFAGAFGEEPATVLPRALVSELLSLGWLFLVLQIHRKPERFVQTATAMLGVMLLVAPLTLPLLAAAMPIVEAAASGKPAVDLGPVPVVAMFAALAASLYLLVVQARILGDAIERPLFPCLVLVLLGELLVVMAMGALGFGGGAPTPA
jgi:hypothetical protein